MSHSGDRVSFPTVCGALWCHRAGMSSTLAAALVRAIIAERHRLGISQQELADRLGWHKSTVYKIEAGDRALKVHEMPELCEALETTLPRLLIAASPADLRRLGL